MWSHPFCTGIILQLKEEARQRMDLGNMSKGPLVFAAGLLRSVILAELRGPVAWGIFTGGILKLSRMHFLVMLAYIPSSCTLISVVL